MNELDELRELLQRRHAEALTHRGTLIDCRAWGLGSDGTRTLPPNGTPCATCGRNLRPTKNNRSALAYEVPSGLLHLCTPCARREADEAELAVLAAAGTREQ